MKKLFLTLILLTPLTFAEQKEPSEVKEIRDFYAQVKAENTKNVFNANYTKRFEDEGEERDRPLTEGKLTAYFADHNQEQLNLIILNWKGSIDGEGSNYEYLFKDDLIFAYAKIVASGVSYELRCYFKEQKLIHNLTKGEEGSIGFDNENPETQCQEVRQNARLLKSSVINLQKNAN